MTKHNHLINFKEVRQTPNDTLLTERPKRALLFNYLAMAWTPRFNSPHLDWLWDPPYLPPSK